MCAKRRAFYGTTGLLSAILLLTAFPLPAMGELDLGPEELVEANGAVIAVPLYSVPSYVNWDGDGIPDLVIGEGPSGGFGKVRVYLNTGTLAEPEFGDYTFVQSNGSDLSVIGSGCLGIFPRAVYWDADSKIDLLIGMADGRVKLYTNNSDPNVSPIPTFDGGEFLTVGTDKAKVIIDVGLRATSTVVDWNSDGKKDLAVGAYDGNIHVFINEGTDTSPDFITEVLAQDQNGTPVVVPSARSSPVVLDLDDDGKKDLLTGNTNGQLLLYSNTGTEQDPTFYGYSPVEANGVPIDLPSTPRSRPSVCDWTGDGALDVLIGAYGGNVHLYQGFPPVPGDCDDDDDVDLQDFLSFQTCYTGPGGGPVAEGCQCVDFDGDDDVDLLDFLNFQTAYTGP